MQAGWSEAPAGELECLDAFHIATLLKPNSAMLPAFIDIGEVLVISVIVADADREWIAKGPLHLTAMDADRYRGMRRAMNELHCQRIDLSHVAAINTSNRCKRIDQNFPLTRIHTDPNTI